MYKTRNKRVLITGGAGFLGSHLCERYLAMDYEVICLDNFYTGTKHNIANIMDHRNFEIVRHDIIESYFCEVDLILNFACPASPIHYQHNPIKTLKTSVLGVSNLLGMAKRIGARFLQASTSEVYGDPKQHPQRESYWGNVNPIGTRSCYDEGKRAAETLCFDYHRQHGVDVRIVRIFNTYGPRMDINDGRVVSNFICQALHSDDITVYGDGSQSRSFCFYEDLIDGIVTMADSDDFIGPVNLGSYCEVTIVELAKTIINLTNSSSRIIYKPLPFDDPKTRRPDLNLASQKLNYQPKTDLPTGLKKTIPYFKNLLQTTIKKP